MTDPATVIDPVTAEIIRFDGPTVPATKYRELEQLLAETERERDELQVEVKERGRSLGALRAKNTKLRRELADVYEEAADASEWAASAEWWRCHTGRSSRTDLGLGTARCEAYRKLRRKWSQREVALMVVGVYADPFRRREGLTEFADILKRPEHWLQAGIDARGGRG